MRDGFFSRALPVTLVAMGLGLCLFADSAAFRSVKGLGSIVGEVLVAFRDPPTQWMVFLFAGGYFVVFALLQHRQAARRLRRMDDPDLWLIGALLVGSLVYAFNNQTASQSTQALLLLAGTVFGKGAALWASWTARSQDIKRKSGLVIVLLIVMLSVSSLWPSDVVTIFQYRGQARWREPWDNPNTFGMLMGLGLTLALGELVSSFKFSVSSRQGKKIARWFYAVLFLIAAVLLGIGLTKSYSRGAWVGVVSAVAYLVWQALERGDLSPLWESRQVATGKSADESAHSILKASPLPIGIIAVSIFVIAFWYFRDAEHHVARRTFSGGNINDFSWRNRVAAYEGSLQMMASKPLFGFGWNQPEKIYGQYYAAPKVGEGMAIHMNDYFTLGTTLGIPALLCFVGYIWLSLTWRAERGTQNGNQKLGVRSEKLEWEKAICRAGAIVLLVGFFFDGGLFKLATGATFWILLELGREDKLPMRMDGASSV